MHCVRELFECPSTTMVFSKHGFQFSKHVRACRHGILGPAQDEVDDDLALFTLPEGVTYGWLADYVYRCSGLSVNQACRTILSEPCLEAHAGRAVVQRQIRSIVVAMIFAYRRMALNIATVFTSGLHEDVRGDLSWRACYTELSRQGTRPVPFGLSDADAPAVKLPTGWLLPAQHFAAAPNAQDGDIDENIMDVGNPPSPDTH